MGHPVQTIEAAGKMASGLTEQLLRQGQIGLRVCKVGTYPAQRLPFDASRIQFLCGLGEIRNLVDPPLECDQVAINEFIAGTGEFVWMANLDHFTQALVGIEAHAVPIGNGDQHQVKKLFQTG